MTPSGLPRKTEAPGRENVTRDVESSGREVKEQMLPVLLFDSPPEGRVRSPTAQLCIRSKELDA